MVHAVSAGEAMSAGALVRALADERPDWSVILTCGNQDARAVGLSLRRRLSTVEAVINLPWDRGASTRRWLRDLHASAVVVVEPEIWPNLYRACGVLEVPLFLVNGHLYPRDVGRYRVARRFFADVLSVPAWIGVQTSLERDRFVAIGTPAERIEVVGSLKFDAALHPDESDVWSCVRAVHRSGHPLLVAGSTYRMEEDCLIRTLERLRPRFPELRLVLAPRHVTRAEGLVARASARGHHVVKASAIDPSLPGSDPSSWDVMVVDRLGELCALYGLADIAFVGGTLVPRGGHNVLEPARLARAIIVGPFADHVRDLVEGLAAVNGIVRVSDTTPDAFGDVVGQLLENASARQALGDRAQAYCAGHRGAARRSVEAIIGRMQASVDSRVAISARDPQLAPRETWPLGASEAES